MERQQAHVLAQLALDLGEEPTPVPSLKGPFDTKGGANAIDDVEARRRSEEARLLFESADPLGGRGKNLTWFERYQDLRGYGFSWRIAAYIAWASSPKEKRWPEKVDDLAKKVLGLNSARAIYTWRERNPAIDEMIGVMQSAEVWEHRADIFQAMIEVAKKPDYKGFNDRKMMLELMGDIKSEAQGPVLAVTINDIRTMSTQELVVLAAGRPSTADRSDRNDPHDPRSGNDPAYVINPPPDPIPEREEEKEVPF